MLTLFLVLASTGYARRIQTESDTPLDSLATHLLATNPILASRFANRLSVSETPGVPTVAAQAPVRASVQMLGPKSELGAEDSTPPNVPVEPKKKRSFWRRFVAPALLAARVGQAVPAVAASVGTNQIAGAAGFFAGIRIPATLLTGTALAALFVDFPDTGNKRFPVWRFLYLCLAMNTVALELTTVFMSTTMGVRLLAGGYDPVALNAVALLRREFEFEYIAVRLSFFTGIVNFLSCICVRIWMTYGDTPNMSRGIIFLLLSFIAFFDGFWRNTVVSYGGYFEMLGRLIHLYFTDFFVKQPFVSTLGLCCLVTSIVCFVLGARDGWRERMKRWGESQGQTSE